MALTQVSTSGIKDGSVSTADLADGSITTAKVADGGVTTAKVADGGVTTAKIADDAITADKLNNTGVTAGSYTLSSVTVDAQGRVTAASSGTPVDADKIIEGNTEVEAVDTGSDGHIKATTEGSERLRVGPAGQVGIGGANYGTSGQVFMSGGASAAPTWGDVSSSPTIEATASGALTNGAAVVVNSDGTVSVVAGVSQTQSIGSVAQFETGDVTFKGVCYDTGNDKVVVAYTDSSNSEYGTACVGTVSGTSISWGTPVVFNSASSEEIDIAYDANSGKVVIAFRDDAQGRKGVAIVGTVSGTSISFGSKVVFEDGRSDPIRICYDANAQKVVIAYSDFNDSEDGKCIVGTVSGTSISFGSPATFSTGNIESLDLTYVSSVNKFVVIWRDTSTGNYYGYAAVGTISGTSISYGTTAAWETSSNIASHCRVEYHPEDDRILILSKDGVVLYGYVGTISGTTLSFPASRTSVYGNVDTHDLCYDSQAQQLIIFYNDGIAACGKVRRATINTSTNQATYSSAAAITTNNISTAAAVFDPDEKTNVVVFHESGVGKAVAYDPPIARTNAASFIGFADAAYANGATATIQVVGSVDDAQSGLTTGQKHYVQNDGSLSTDEDSPSVLAGVALSATKLLIK